MKKRTILKLINIISLLMVEVFLCCFSFFDSTTNKNAELSLLTTSSKTENAESYFFNTIFEGGDEQLPVNYFLRTYGQNFWESITKIISICNDYEPIRYNCYIGEEQFVYDTTVISGINYTQNEELLRFETICINLYKFRTKAEELVFDQKKFDGFIYLPDYFANSIISSYENINSYEDLFDETFVFSIETDYKRYNYKVANVFHVEGFLSNEYQYNDYNFGKKINSYLNGFCFVSNYMSFVRDGGAKLALTSMCQPKKFIVEKELDNINTFISSKVTKEPTLTLFMVNDNIKYYDRSVELNNSFFGNNGNIFVLFLIPLVISGLLFIFSVYYLYIKGQLYKNNKINFCISFIILALAHFITLFFPSSFFVLSAFNYLFNSVTCLLFAIFLAMHLFLKFHPREIDNV